MVNLDSKINERSYEIVQGFKKVDVQLIIDKALGVLTNDGVYAYYVYIKGQAKGCIFNQTFEQLIVNMVDTFGPVVDNQLGIKSPNIKDYDKYFCNLSKDIHKLLFFKDILEKTLTYARYHAKAVGDRND